MLNRNRKVIVVIGMTRAEVALGVAHAHTAVTSLPIWTWCVEPCEPLPGCDHFSSGSGALTVWKDLWGVWPALSIVSWTGVRKASALKLLPLFLPPFRVVAFNEASGFFAVRPASLLNHAGRRVHDAGLAAGRRLIDWFFGLGQWIAGLRQWLRSLCYRSVERVRDLLNLIFTLFLAALAVAARPTALMARRAMKRHLGKSAEHKAELASGSSFIEIPLVNRGWPRRAVLKALENSTVDFVVFRAQGEHSAAEPLVALARETNAFSTARQIAWSGWRDTVLHRHPFRTLQPGEVTQVEAPHSGLIVMRRDLLQRFGVPHALTSGAAFMQLYWKAAAAGLESLVAGYSAAVTQEPAMQLEDAEFVLRRSRRIAPARPESSRGNIAWSPLHRKPFRAKPRALVVSPYLPFPLSHGGAVRIYNLCRAMAGDIDFVLACFREANETVRYPELHEVFREVHVVDIDEKQSDPDVPAQVAGYRNSAMAGLIGELCFGNRVDLAQLEYTQMAEYREYTGSVPVILVEHDITFTLYSQLGNVEQHRLWRDFETKALKSSTAVWTMSGQDRALAIEHGASPLDTVVVANGVDAKRFKPARKACPEQRVLFVGSFRHPPNLLAFEAMRDTIMPAVWDACPSAILHVIAGPNNVRLTGLDPRIVIEGFVEDVRPAYRDCDVVVVPLPVSAGTNIKVMEAMACGRAVVSTPVGCQGLGLHNAADVLIRDIGPEFSNAITLLLWDDALRARIGERARETAERRFDWNDIAREAMTSYASILDMMWNSDEDSPRDRPSYLPAICAGATK